MASSQQKPTMSGSSGYQPNQEHEVHNGISPILLKHFNMYEPLTPKKVVSPNSSLNEDLLIDFESPVEVKRKVEKEDDGFDVIDLFQNIYVTPELVNSKPKTKIETDVDYQDFIRKFETINKDLPQNSETVPPKNCLLDYDFTCFNEIPETQNRPETNINDSNKISLCVETMSSYSNEDDEYQEELIEEILLDRTLEKLKLSRVKNEQTSKNLKVLKTPNISNNNFSQLHNATNLSLEQFFSKTQDPKTDPYWKRDNIPTLNIYDHDSKDRYVYFNQNKTKQENLNVLGLKHTISNNNHLQSTSSTISNNISNKQIPLDNQLRFVSEESFNINQNRNIIKACSSTDRYCDENTMPSRNYTILNDKSNQCEDTLRNEGTLHLKTPQQNHHNTHDYMQLDAKRDVYSNERTIPTRNHNDKNDNSLYDSKNFNNYANLNITPKVMNSDNLRELKSTVNDSQSKSFISDITTLLHLTVDPGKMNTVPVQAVVKDNKEYAKSHKTKSIAEKLTYFKGPDLNEKRIVLPHLLSRLSEQENKRDAKNNTKKRLLLYSDSIEVKTCQDQASKEFKPTILKDDCNKERLVAFKIRQSLSKLVESGNILE